MSPFVMLVLFPLPRATYGLHVVCPNYPDTIFILLGASLLCPWLHPSYGGPAPALRPADLFTAGALPSSLTPLLCPWLLAFQMQTHSPTPLFIRAGMIYRDPPEELGLLHRGFFCHLFFSSCFGV